MFSSLINFVREQYQSNELIPLHSPVFSDIERSYVNDTIDTTYVSSVGEYVTRFERNISIYTTSPCAVATVTGTAALHIALKLAGVRSGDLVLTQPLTFVATCNSITYCGAEPVFIDVDFATLGLSPSALEEWLDTYAYITDDGQCRSRDENRIISACVPMHTFGHPVDLDGLIEVCDRWHLAVVEDAAESLGSLYKGRHTGTFGQLGVISFNGNKIITSGGGGMILTNEKLGQRAKHITTTAKCPHPYEYFHDEVGYNYRLPNINAALGCAQLERIEEFVAKKRKLASIYEGYFHGSDLQFFTEPKECRSNYWLNAVICSDREHRDILLKTSNAAGVMMRPIWTLMNSLPYLAHCRRGTLKNAEWLQARVVNLPSSVLPEEPIE